MIMNPDFPGPAGDPTATLGATIDPTPTSAAASTNTPISASLSGTLTNVELADPLISLGDYCDRRGLPCSSYDAVDRRRPGNVFSYSIETIGYEGEQLPIRWSMYDAQSGQRIDEPTHVYQDGWPDGVYTPFATQDRNSGELWIPLSSSPGTFFVRLELYPPDGARLDWEDSEPFDVS